MPKWALKHEMKEIDPDLFFYSTITMYVWPTSTLIQACLLEDFCVLDDDGLHIYYIVTQARTYGYIIFRKCLRRC